jgi:apolipoprotein N-acyltransferase
LIRVGNNGISAVIDPYGRILGKIGLDERSFLDVSLPKFIQGHTLYFYYGDKILFLMLLLIFGFVGFGELLSRKRR